MLRRFRRLAPFLCGGLLVLMGLGCQVPVRTVLVGPEKTYRDLDANALSSDDLSSDSGFVLNRYELAEEYENDPVAAIQKLHAVAIDQPSREVLFALAETNYLAAQRGYARDGYLAAAIYAYHYLLDTDSAPANPYGRSFRAACDLYNRGLLKALRSPDGERFLLTSGNHELPVGRLEIHTDMSGFEWSQVVNDEYLPADNLRVIGLSSRRRFGGLGVPLIAVVKPKASDKPSVLHVPPRSCVAATAFLRVDGRLADLANGGTATLELHSTFDVTSVKVAERSVPLEVDLTAPLAYQLGSAKSWDLEIGAFFRSDEYEKDAGIWTLQPYQPGKIPVVFVHGTASSPARWAEMFNELNADADLRSKYQFWFFTYTTGNPVVYSAAILRDALTSVIAELDPEGKDPSLRNMVLIGHSQGGILAKLQAIHSGDAFWNNLKLTSLPMDKLTDDDRARLRRLLVFEPQPAVKRLVFIATPHGGSFLAGGWIGRILTGLIDLPSRLGDRLAKVVDSPELREKLLDEFPTAVDNMTANHPFVKALATLDVAEGVHCHSIIAVEGEGPPDDLDDGLVQYKSAHLAHADSEIVVRSFHSCQAHPRTIEEVRRILLLHLRESVQSRP